jgi:hypothetical protein
MHEPTLLHENFFDKTQSLFIERILLYQLLSFPVDLARDVARLEILHDDLKDLRENQVDCSNSIVGLGRD